MSEQEKRKDDASPVLVMDQKMDPTKYQEATEVLHKRSKTAAMPSVTEVFKRLNETNITGDMHMVREKAEIKASEHGEQRSEQRSEHPAKENEGAAKSSARSVKESGHKMKERPIKVADRPGADTDRANKEADRPLKETERAVKESERSDRESEHPAKESDNQIKETTAAAVTVEQHKQSAKTTSSSNKKRDSSPEIIQMSELSADAKIHTPIPIPPDVMAVESGEIATRKSLLEVTIDKSLESSPAAVRTDLDATHSDDWSDVEEAGGLPRSESRSSRVSRAVRQLFCCGVLMDTPSEHIISPRAHHGI